MKAKDRAIKVLERHSKKPLLGYIIVGLIGIVLGLVIGRLLVYPPAKSPVDGSPQSATATITKRVSLPYSEEKDGLKIIILEVVPAKEKHGTLISKGYRQWTVNFRYENLLNIDFELPVTVQRSGHCVGLVSSLKLKTDKGNLYKPRFVGGESECLSLKPKSSFEKKELYVFEILEDEIPIELWGYLWKYEEFPSREERLAYIFTLTK